MKRRLLLTGCIAVWAAAAAFGAVEAFVVCWCVYHGRYAAENLRAEEAASAALWCAMLLLPLLLILLCVAVYATVLYKEHSGRTPGEKR